MASSGIVLFVSNLKENTSVDDVKHMFEPSGGVIDVHMPPTRKNFARVEFSTKEAAEAARAAVEGAHNGLHIELLTEFPNAKNLDWVRPYLPLPEAEQRSAELKLEAVNNAGGLSAEMRRLTVTVPGTDYKRSFLYKSTAEGTHTSRMELGCPREGLFYNSLAPKLREEGTQVAETIFAYGNMRTGDKTLIMEDLSTNGIQSGYFYGSGSPLNWAVDIAAKLAAVPVTLTTEEVALDSFQQAARLHRCYWKDESLFQYDWLRGTEWIQGKGRDSFETAQNTAINCWRAIKEKIANGTSAVNWDPELVAVLDASLAKVNFDDYVNRLRSGGWSLVHGDFHPANMMWVWSAEHPRGHSVLVDWEMVGIGTGAQDVSQSLISHMAPEVRRSCERRLVEAYYQTLTEGGHVSDYTLEQCWADYVQGGSGRWLWFVPVLDSMCPPSMSQYFHDQLAAFVKDHNITPENVGQPRV